MKSATRPPEGRFTRESDLFQILRDGQPRTRVELAHLTGLSRSTVALRVDALVNLGLVQPIGEAVSTGGRPSPLFALNPAARLVVAADIGASHASVAVVDLSGVVMIRHDEDVPVSDGPERVLSWVVDSAEELLAKIDRSKSDLISVGIGLPGPVEHSTGRPTNPGNMPGWDHFDVRDWVRQRWNVPVLVDNDVNIMALGERELSWPNVEHLIFIKVATGIGAGVISGGRLLRGAQGIAGDIGHVKIARGDGVPCHCGNMGCLEAMASGPAVSQALRATGLDVESAQSVVELVRHGNVEAVQAVRQAGRDIAEVLTPCVSLVNPSIIAVGGSMSQAGEHLIAGIREVVYARSMPLATEHLSIVQSRAAENAGIIGASILAIEHVLSPEGIDAMHRPLTDG